MTKNKILLFLTLTFLTFLIPHSILSKNIEKILHKAEINYEKGNYKKVFSTTNSLIKKITKKNKDLSYLPAIYSLQARCYEAKSDFRNYEKAIASILAVVKNTPKEGKEYIKSLIILAETYIEYGDVPNASIHINEAFALLSNNKIDEEKFFIRIYIVKAKISILKNNFRESYQNCQIGIKLIEEKFPFIKNRKVKLTSENKKNQEDIKIIYATLLNLYAYTAIQQGNNLKSDSILQQSHTWIKKEIGRNTKLYYENLFNQVLFQELLENKELAREKIVELKHQLTRHRVIRSKLYVKIYEELIKIDLDLANFKNVKKELKDFKSFVIRLYSIQSLYYISYKTLETEYKNLLQPHISFVNTYETLLSSESSLPKLHPYRITIFKKIIKNASSSGELSTTEKYFASLFTIKEKLYGTNSGSYHLAKINYANYLVNYANDFKKAENIYKVSFDSVIQKEFYPYHSIYINSLKSIAHFYELTDQFEMCSAVLNKMSAMLTKKYSTKDENLANHLLSIATIEIKIGNYTEAEKSISKAVTILKDNQSENYCKALEVQAKLFLATNAFESAEENLQKCLRFYEKEKRNEERTEAAEDLSILFLRIGKYNQTEQLLNYSIKEKIKYGENHRFLIQPYIQLAQLEIIKGNYTEAEKLAEKARIISQKCFGEISTSTVACMSTLADIAMLLGNYEKSDNLLKKIIRIEIKLLGNEHIDIAKSFIQLANSYIYQDNQLNKADSLFQHAKAIIEKKIGKQSVQYADVLTGLAKIDLEKNKLEQSISSLEEAKSILTERLGKEFSLQTADILLLLGDVHTKQKKFQQAENTYYKVKKIYEKITNSKHPKSVKVLSKLAHLYYMMGKYEEAKSKADEVITIYTSYLDRYFPALSEREKTRFWNLIKIEFEFYNCLALKLIKQKPEISYSIYNYSVLQKALLLHTALKIKERILTSDNNDLKKKYTEWIEKKELLGSITSLSEEEIKKNNININGLDQEVEKLEKELSERSEDFKASYENIKIDWKKTQSGLKKDEAAIEISRFRYFNESFTDSIIYAITIVKPDQKKPQVIFIYNGKELEEKYIKYYRNSIKYNLDDSISYSYFWQPFEESIQNYSTIYLSPDGVYNQLNVETLSKHRGEYLLDKKNIVLVNSTKDIYLNKVRHKNTTETKQVAIFGNPEFYISLTHSNQKSIKQLPGAELESKELKELMQQNGWNSNLFLFQEATEENIKAIENPTIIHIATHGLFVESKEEENELNDLVIFQNPMLKSGLLLKGAGDLLTDNETTYNLNKDNGILTAYEAMNLNCDHTELVVLSACETGLGDIKTGEGVYGLQRAFLVAGAKNVIMSLFKISDQVTQELMITFYKKWLITGKKRESFTEAKREIRNKYPEPIYWGSFVMIGLE